MKANMGLLDRAIRLIITFVIFGLYYANVISGTLAIVLIVVAGIFFLTSLMGFCPLYTIFGISTRKKSQQQ